MSESLLVLNRLYWAKYKISLSNVFTEILPGSAMEIVNTHYATSLRLTDSGYEVTMVVKQVFVPLWS